MRLAGLILILAMLFTSCSGNSGQTGELQNGFIDEGIPAGVNDAVTQTSSEDSGPMQGGRLKLFMLMPDSLNPLYTDNADIRYLSSFVFDPLYRWNEKDGLKNFLAESQAFSNQNLILDIKLRDGILFHDGQPLSSADVAFTIKTIQQMKDKSPYFQHVAAVDSIIQVDRLNVRLILKYADPYILEKLTFPILPEHVFKNWPVQGIDNETKIIGTGAFKFDTYDGGILSISRNESWWYTSTPEGLTHPIWMDGIDYKVCLNAQDQMDAFQKHEIDVALIDEGSVDNYARRIDITLNRFQGNHLEYMILSNKAVKDSPVANVQFRDVLMKYIGWCLALEPLSMGEAITGDALGYGSESNRLNREQAIEALIAQGFAYDAAKNIMLINKNGSKLPLTLTISYNMLDMERSITGDWLSQTLSEIGISAVLQKTGETEEKSMIQNGHFEIMLLGCRMPLAMNVKETLDHLKLAMGYQNDSSVLLPLYRKNNLVIYQNRLKGPRFPDLQNPYNGWMEWYLVQGNQ